MLFKATANPSGSTLSGIRCPACGQLGTFHASSVGDIGGLDASGVQVLLGHRVCPNTSCRTHLFVGFRNDQILVSYPAQRIDFDATNIPAEIKSALEESITCHAHQCYVAAAIMVRKTLELLCIDRGATGGNLKEKLQDLGGKVVLPKELFNGLDDLRLLGNDAAHIQSTAYQQVGEEEISVAILFTKEVLKAVFQYSTLLGRLKALKKP